MFSTANLDPPTPHSLIHLTFAPSSRPTLTRFTHSSKPPLHHLDSSSSHFSTDNIWLLYCKVNQSLSSHLLFCCVTRCCHSGFALHRIEFCGALVISDIILYLLHCRHQGRPQRRRKDTLFGIILKQAWMRMYVTLKKTWLPPKEKKM